MKEKGNKQLEKHAIVVYDISQIYFSIVFYRI